MHLTTVITAPMRQCHKRTLFVATDMLSFDALQTSKNGVCLYTISRLCLFQAVLLLAQCYTMHLTTVITAPMRQCHKRTLFVAAGMQIFGALKSSKNGKEELIFINNAPEHSQIKAAFILQELSSRYKPRPMCVYSACVYSCNISSLHYQYSPAMTVL
jgi:hypothetical protein